MIKQDTIRNILDAARIDEVISEFVTLKKRGGNFVGLCPFHNEKTPSFTVSPAKGIYKCFGCGKAGDVIRFMMDHDQLNYPEALRYLASKYGVEIEEENVKPEDKEAKNLRESLFLVNTFAAEQFSKYLWEDEKGKAIALSYFISRGFDEKTIKQFQLGYCPEGRNTFSKLALDKGYSGEYLEKTGLSLNKEGNYIDRFWGRVMFPIHNLSGRIIGFGGRTLRSDKKIAKYVNSPESDIYNKSRELYGLFFTKRDVVKEDFCYLVEGYTDVVSMYQSGITNTAAPLGTSLTEDQIKLLRRYTNNVVLLFDGDEAGVKATARAIDMILEAGMNASVVLFPDGQDPDSYSKEHSDEELKDFLESSKMDFISFYLKSRRDNWANDPVKKAELMKIIINSIAKIPDHLLRSLFIKDFAQKTEINEKSAIFELNRIRKNILKKAYNTDEVLPVEEEKISIHNEEAKKLFEVSTEKKEEKIISFLVRYATEHLNFNVKKDGTTVEEINMLVAEYIVGEIERDEVVFRYEKYRKIYTYFKSKIENSEIPDQYELLENADEEIKDVCYGFMTSKHELSSNWKDKYHIETPLEKENLRTHINRDLYAIKLSEIMIRLAEFEERIKIASEDEVDKLLRQQKKLSDAKRAFAGKLGMTIN